jgi:E3 ubiquitin-protein ligase UBR2
MISNHLFHLIQGMDDVQRQSGEHQVWESEWETAFNIQLRVQNIITLIVAWASTDVCC